MLNFGATLSKMLDSLVDQKKLLPYQGDWVPPDHVDRLRQYEVFRALAENRFGGLLKDREAAKKLRMYGDYGLIVEASRDAVLGDRIEISVPGSSDRGNAGAVARQELLDAWAQRERWASKVYQCETDAAEVGDSVYELRGEGPRLRLRVHDPEAFFPVWDNKAGDFSQAYLAWEEMNTGQYLPEPQRESANLKDLRDRDGEVVLYRRHYQLVEAAEAGVKEARERDYVCVVSAGWYRIETRDGEAPSGFKALALLGSEALDDDTLVDNLDTGFDEIPLFYVPNRESSRQPWGLPEGDRVLQVLLDAAQDHTDLKANTLYNAFPPLYDENSPQGSPPRPGHSSTPKEQKYQPGVIYNGRKLGAVDLSNGNALLLEHERFLIDKALTNTRTTQLAAGRVELSNIPSGVALLIAMLPLFAKTLPKRQTRQDKLGMLLKHVLRWHRAWGDPGTYFVDEATGEGATEWPEGTWDDEVANPVFGSIIPIDKKQVSEMVAELMAAQAISEETAVTMLQMAGFPIDDAAEEVERLTSGAILPMGSLEAARTGTSEEDTGPGGTDEDGGTE